MSSPKFNATPAEMAALAKLNKKLYGTKPEIAPQKPRPEPPRPIRPTPMPPTKRPEPPPPPPKRPPPPPPKRPMPTTTYKGGSTGGMAMKKGGKVKARGKK
jgi:hypothetical protein